MAGIRKSARLVEVKAKCGHYVSVMIPPGELGTVGRRKIGEASSRKCYKCRVKGKTKKKARRTTTDASVRRKYKKGGRIEAYTLGEGKASKDWPFS